MSALFRAVSPCQSHTFPRGMQRRWRVCAPYEWHAALRSRGNRPTSIECARGGVRSRNTQRTTLREPSSRRGFRCPSLPQWCRLCLSIQRCFNRVYMVYCPCVDIHTGCSTLITVRTMCVCVFTYRDQPAPPICVNP